MGGGLCLQMGVYGNTFNVVDHILHFLGISGFDKVNSSVEGKPHLFLLSFYPFKFFLLSFRQQTFTCKGTIPLKRLPNGWKHIFWVNLTESFCQSVRPWGLGSEVLPFNRWLGQKAQIWLFSRLPFNIIWEWGNELLVNITFWHDIICAVPVQTTRKSLQNPKMTNGFLVM